MTRLESQIRELPPSVKDALFRRLMFADELAWLRDEKKKDRVTGFEVDLEDQELSGFALIAIQRHTVIAFVSDRDESPRLILFPTLETLFDPGFELLDLMVTRKEFRDAAFRGAPIDHGRFGDMVKDLTPPNRKVDISDTVMEQMAANIQKAESVSTAEEQAEPVKEETPASHAEPETVETADYEDEPGYEEPPYEDGPPEGFDDEPNDFDNYMDDSYGGYDDYEEDEPEPEPEPVAQSRSEILKAQTFSSLNDVIDFVVMKQGVNRPLAVTLANKAMQSQVAPEFRVQLAVNIFCKLMDENKI